MKGSRPDRIVVVGSGIAGVSAVRALRAQGYRGGVVMLGAEGHAPYDRPPLSKEFLAGAVAVDALALIGPDDAALDVEFRPGSPVRSVAPATRELVLDGGDRVPYDGLVIATGAAARRLDLPLEPSGGAPPGPDRGVHVLRSIDDALALRECLLPGARLVVVGGGFLGAEVASTARSLGAVVTVLETAAEPLGAFGPVISGLARRLYADHGVTLRTGVRPVALHVNGAGPAPVDGVRLADGELVPADVVLAAVGADPVTGWLAGSGLENPVGVLVDPSGRTAIPGIVAVGDVAAPADPVSGVPRAGRHWTDAVERPAEAVAALLGHPVPRRDPVRALPYVWSHQFGVMFQFAGAVRPGDVLRIVDGDPATSSFVGVYGPPTSDSADDSPSGPRSGAGATVRAVRPGPEGDVVPVAATDVIGGLAHAVVGVNAPRVFTRTRKALARHEAATLDNSE